MTELLKASTAALHALRSYQYGNSSPELAEEIADSLEEALIRALDDRDQQLESVRVQIGELETMLKEIMRKV